MQMAAEEKYLVINNPLNCDSIFTPAYATTIFISALRCLAGPQLWAVGSLLRAADGNFLFTPEREDRPVFDVPMVLSHDHGLAAAWFGPHGKSYVS